MWKGAICGLLGAVLMTTGGAADDVLEPFAGLYTDVDGYRNPVTELSKVRCGEVCVLDYSSGGWLIQFQYAAANIIYENRYVVLDGECASACTVMVDILNQAGRVCIMPNAVFLVHKAYDNVPGPDGPVFVGRSDVAYSPGIRSLIDEIGEQPEEGFLEIEYESLARVVPECGPDGKPVVQEIATNEGPPRRF